MSKLYVLHNNRCSKSRNAIQLLEEKNIAYEFIPYLDGVLNEKDIEELLQKLNLNAIDIVRKSEAIYKDNFKGKDLDNTAWITALQQNPKLIERPILYTKDKAVVGRPLENVEEFLKTL